MSKKDVPARSAFMTASQRDKLGSAKRTHQNCKELFEVGRPGKTAQDRARQGR